MNNIGFLATGNEMTQGDTLNTNSQVMAQCLTSEGLEVGLHMVCSDEQIAMTDCLKYLMASHEVIIIIGGLGPTSDDRTRFALSEVLKESLVESELAIKHIKNRLNKQTLSEGNLQQALFPKNVTIIPNPRGSAVGAYGNWEGKLFILLPGPPRECLPMFYDHVMPLLRQRQSSSLKLYKWLIFGLAESMIAESLDKALSDLDCETGYRLDIPYIEFKVRCEPALFNEVNKRIQPLIKQHLISSGNKKASQELFEKIIGQQIPLSIIDDVTGGYLQTLLQKPESFHLLSFHEIYKNQICFHLSGLVSYWTGKNDDKNKLMIQCNAPGKQTLKEEHITDFRSSLLKQYAAEWLSFRISQFIDEQYQ